MQIPVPSLEDHAALTHFAGLLGLSLAASAFVIVSRLSVVPILYGLRLGHRASLIPAINLAQVSEFSDRHRIPRADNTTSFPDHHRCRDCGDHHVCAHRRGFDIHDQRESRRPEGAEPRAQASWHQRPGLGD